MCFVKSLLQKCQACYLEKKNIRKVEAKKSKAWQLVIVNKDGGL